MEKKIFSGIQPTGSIHLGNYLGAIKNWISLQSQAPTLFTVVDLHAITIPYQKDEMSETTLNTAATILACGLDPKQTSFFIQSQVGFHTQLMWLLASIAPYGDLTRMTQFKDKSAQHAHNINAGLFFYPILMTADILLYKATHVPVGQDQLQHLELTREIARRFNERYDTDIFPLPEPILSETQKLKGLDGKVKMSKSLNNYIALTDPPSVLKEKLSKAVTDENRIKKSDPGDPLVCNIFTMHKEFSSPQEQKNIIEGCTTATMGCVECKKCLFYNLNQFLEPIQEKVLEYKKNPDNLKHILIQGAKKASLQAEKTYEQVTEMMGITY